jgi:hypothetical protein
MIIGTDQPRGSVHHAQLPKSTPPRNLVWLQDPRHNRLTYHRTWETGLETEIRVADFSPAFFCPGPDSP